MKKILKSGGYCSEGCQWFFCDFLRIERQEQGWKRNQETGELEVTYSYSHHCDLFAGTKMLNGSLNICNKIYGRTYEGDV